MIPKALLAENLDYLILVYSVSLILSYLLKKTEKTEQVEEKTGSLGPKPPPTTALSESHSLTKLERIQEKPDTGPERYIWPIS